MIKEAKQVAVSNLGTRKLFSDGEQFWVMEGDKEEGPYGLSYISYTASEWMVIDESEDDTLPEWAELKCRDVAEHEDAVKEEVWFGKVPVLIEFRSGEMRKGFLLNYDYGRIPGTNGGDGMDVDCIIGLWNDSEKVFLIGQNEEDVFDEFKVMLGFADWEDAVTGWESMYGASELEIQVMTELSLEDFEEWLEGRKND